MADVLHLINGLGTGGAERSLAQMVGPLADYGVRSSIAVLHERSEGVEQLVRSGGTPVYPLAGSGSLTKARSLRNLLARERPDLLHTTIFESDVVGRLAALRTQVPVVSSLVNMSYGPERAADPNVVGWKLSAARRLDSATARHLTVGFHAITEAVAEAAIESLGIKREAITVVPRGRDSAALGTCTCERRDRVRTDMGLSVDSKVILNVARQEYQKDQATLLRAFAQVRESEPAAALLVAGRSGNATNALQELAGRLGIGDAVTFLGHRDDVPDLLCACDLFVLPSRYEGLGCSVIEALGMGTPVVASDIAPLREVLQGGRCGLLATAGDDSLFRRRILDAFSNPREASRRSEVGQALFKAKFELEQVVPEMAAWFKEMAEKGSVQGDPGG